jgi:exosortase A-associated hydrolase 2
LFLVEYEPDAARERDHTVVVVPPFAEEMNRSRRMVALQARELASQGIRVLVFDLFGTGDSDGDFGDARWEGWLADLDVVVSSARASGARASLLGIRLGALLAVEAAARAPDLDTIALWQPCTSGKVYLRQFLRLRMAESLINDKPGAGSVSASLAELAAGESLEIAGYRLAPALAEAVQARSFDNLRPQPRQRLRWLDVVAAEGDPPPAATQGVVAAWSAAGVDVRAEAVQGEPFWSLQEITVAPRLLPATAHAFAAD